MTDLQHDIWHALPVPAMVVDAENHIASVNPAAEDFVTVSARTIQNRPVSECLRTDVPLAEALHRVRGNGAPVYMSNINVSHGDGASTACNFRIAPMSGTADHLLLMIEPRGFSDRLDHAMSARASAKSAIGMAEMLAHEIKNPLAGITGAAQLLAMNLSGGDVELTDLIVSESRRIVALLDQVEQFGRLSPPDRRAVNIHDLLDRARRSAEVGFAAHVNFQDDYDPSLPLTCADGDQMLQVLLNLMKNAAEAVPKKGGKLCLRTFYEPAIRLRRDGETAALPLNIEITDNGHGIPADIAADIFDPFVSGRENGTGLGLALVSKIIFEHEGWIGVDSSPGKTTFRLSLPVAPASDA